MDKKELRKLLYEKEKQVEAARSKRMWKMLAGFSVAYYLLLLWFEKPTGLELILNVPASVIFAGIHIWINTPIFHQVFSIAQAEDNILRDIRRQISEQE
jgi:hypothetical protein